MFPALVAPPFLCGTSVKMDFLPLGSVRTDPMRQPNCLSDHVHTFYGAAASLHPEMTYQDMRASAGNSGNVVEDMSLYWHPSVYMYDSASGTYTLADLWFTSAFYVWETGHTTAFPEGFKCAPTASPLAPTPRLHIHRPTTVVRWCVPSQYDLIC